MNHPLLIRLLAGVTLACILPGTRAATAPAAVPTADSTTTGHVIVEGKDIAYRAVAGNIVVRNRDGKPAVRMFYVAYFKDGVKHDERRPLTFFYNGGPGAASMWLHMAAFGPHRVGLADNAHTPAAPYRLVNNDYSLLDATDMVFIDAPGAGYSRIITPQEGGGGKPGDIYGIDQDADVFARFITGFLGKYDRWNSPKLLCGESYGTTRSVVLGRLLQQKYNVKLNGIVLVSALLNFTTSVNNAKFTPGLDISYPLVLPTYAALAWYHGKVPDAPRDLPGFLAGVERYAMTDYAQALVQGARLDDASRRAVAERLHGYTGLPVDYLLAANLRVDGDQFRQQLLRGRGDTIGRLDGRFAGPSMDVLSGSAGYDPAGAAMKGAVATAFNDYVRRRLDYRTALTYRANNPAAAASWDWQHQPPGFGKHTRVIPNVMIDLANEMKYDPGLKVMFNMGYYDLATPYFAADYVIHHLPIPDSLRDNISYHTYPSGHMIYSTVPVLKVLHQNISRFIGDVTGAGAQ